MCNEPVTRTLSSGFSEAYFFRIAIDRKSTRLNSSHITISYAVFCLKKKKHKNEIRTLRDTKGCDHGDVAEGGQRSTCSGDRQRPTERTSGVLRSESRSW